MSSGASNSLASSKPTGTPPRGSASTTGDSRRIGFNAAASCCPASLRSVNMAAPFRVMVFGQIFGEPFRRQPDHLVQGPGFFEQMGSAGNDAQPLFALQQGVGFAVK